MPFILGWVLKLFGGGFFDFLKNMYVAKLQAGNDQDRIVADMVAREAELQKVQAEAQAKIIVAEQGNWITRSIRPLMALPVVVLVWKLLIWDLALGEWTGGSTDRLSEQAFWLVTTIVAAYMGGRTIELTAGKIADAIKGR